MNDGITIVVPVGPQPEYKEYIAECLDSIECQMREDDQIIIIDDQAHLGVDSFKDYTRYAPVYSVDPWGENGARLKYDTPWVVGCADAWNFGVSLARNNLVLLMGSDDALYLGALDAIRESYNRHDQMDALYHLTIRITEGPDKGVHSLFNNAAAVTKGLWKMTGGFPPSAGVGAPDALLISILMVHMPERLIQVREKEPLYWCRTHSAQDTPRQAGVFWNEVISIRDKETSRWKKPEWTK